MKVRIISAIVASLIVAMPIYFGGIPYYAIVGIICVLGFKEIIDLKKAHQNIPIIVSILSLLFLISLTYMNIINKYIKMDKVIILAVISLLIPTVIYKDNKYKTSDAFYIIAATIFLGFVAQSYINVRDYGLKTFIYLISIPIMTDTFAYVMGSMIGKNKMCPSISPNKTWEGFGFGLLFGTFIPSLIYFFMTKVFNFKIILLTIILSLVGQIGDLVFSKIKRENDIKDFSNLMPGHGGVLDRLDSTSFIFMTFLLLAPILF